MDKSLSNNLIRQKNEISLNESALIEFTENELIIVENSEKSFSCSYNDNTEATEQHKNLPVISSPYIMSLKCKQNETKMRTNYKLDQLILEFVNKGNNTCPFGEEDISYEPNLIWDEDIEKENKFPVEDLEISRVEPSFDDYVNEDLISIINSF